MNEKEEEVKEDVIGWEIVLSSLAVSCSAIVIVDVVSFIAFFTIQSVSYFVLVRSFCHPARELALICRRSFSQLQREFNDDSHISESSQTESVHTTFRTKR